MLNRFELKAQVLIWSLFGCAEEQLVRAHAQCSGQIADRVEGGLRGAGLVALDLRDSHPDHLREGLLRTFVYSDAGLLTSTTNPETLNGVVTYTYDSYNRLSTKTDTKGQAFVYSYDTSNRVIEIQKYPQGRSNAEDVCARVNYTYGNDPVSYNYGRLINATTLQVQGTCYSAPSYSESYTYGAPGNVQSKTGSGSV